MGRLVSDDDNIGRFAGSTTGVHFVQLVEHAFQHTPRPSVVFPEDCYRLHLVERRRQAHNSRLAILGASFTEMSPKMYQLLSQDLEQFDDQMQLFESRWGSLCPLFGRSMLSAQLASITNCLLTGATRGLNVSALTQVIVIISLNAMTSNAEAFHDMQYTSRTDAYQEMLTIILPQLLLGTDLESLRAICLAALYAQISGQRLLMSQLNAAMVQLAFSLGLHRHARRFKFAAVEVELRKRIWWFVYLFDMCVSDQITVRMSILMLVSTVATSLGLPKLIRNAYIDNDYPIDCDLSENELIYPLPGESGPLSNFLTIIHLGRIQDALLETLYTTTDRRNGIAKIARLQRDLEAWTLITRQLMGDRFDVSLWHDGHKDWNGFDFGSTLR